MLDALCVGKCGRQNNGDEWQETMGLIDDQLFEYILRMQLCNDPHRSLNRHAFTQLVRELPVTSLSTYIVFFFDIALY